jgi:hypothetical protein
MSGRAAIPGARCIWVDVEAGMARRSCSEQIEADDNDVAFQ